MRDQEVTKLSRVWRWALLSTLYGSKIRSRVEWEWMGPQIYTFGLSLESTKDLNRITKLEEQVALSLSVDSVRIQRLRGSVLVEVAIPKSLTVPLLYKDMEPRKYPWVTLGKTMNGASVHLDLQSPRAAHAIVTGQTGSGKTFTEQLIAFALAQSNPKSVKMLLIDGKEGLTWSIFDKIPHLINPIILDTEQGVKALAWALRELDLRKKQRRNSPTVFIIIDEMKELIDLGGSSVMKAADRLASLGREFGMHICVSTQHLLNETVGGAMTKNNLVFKLIGSVSSSQAAYTASGIANSGAEKLRGRGDFLAVMGDMMVRLQIAMITHRAIADLERTDRIMSSVDLDLDLDRVLGVTPAFVDGSGLGVHPNHTAYALATQRGIQHLKRSLHIGSSPAKRTRTFSSTLFEELKALGYTMVPPNEDGNQYWSFISPGVTK